MPLISDPSQVRTIYKTAAERGICIPDFCTANTRTTEAIFRSVHEVAQHNGTSGLPVIISATGNYEIEPQLRQYTSVDNAEMGLRALLADVDNYLSAESPYNDVAVMLHLDHGQPGADGDLFPLLYDKFATIMYDCSHFPLDENIRMVAKFVRQHQDQILVEGAVDEIIQAEEADHVEGHLTDPDQAARYLQETDVFLIVPNLGTEHRSTAAVAKYEGGLARTLRDRVGTRMVLHGSSSLKDEDLSRLAGDGIIKVNIWSIFERLGGQAVAADVLVNLGNYFGRDQLQAWQEDGWLGPRFFRRCLPA